MFQQRRRRLPVPLIAIALLLLLDSFRVDGFPALSSTLSSPNNGSQAVYRNRPGTLLHARSVELDGEESLVALFERAVVMQRSGDAESALLEYQRFCKVANQCDVPPKQYAEVFVNMGVIAVKMGRKEMAQHYFESALEQRPMGNAHVNLAGMILRSLQTISDRDGALEALGEAQAHCDQAITLKDDPQSSILAAKLLQDISKMRSQIIGE